MHITDINNNDRVLLKDGIKEGKIYKNTIYGSIGITITEDMTKLSNTIVTVMINDWEDYLFFMIAECLIVKTDDNHKYIIPFSFVKQIVKEKKPKLKYTVGQKVLITIDKTSGYTFDDKIRTVPAVISNIDKVTKTIYFTVKGYEHDGVINEARKNNNLSDELLTDWAYNTRVASIVKVLEDGDVNADKK